MRKRRDEAEMRELLDQVHVLSAQPGMTKAKMAVELDISTDYIDKLIKVYGVRHTIGSATLTRTEGLGWVHAPGVPLLPCR